MFVGFLIGMTAYLAAAPLERGEIEGAQFAIASPSPDKKWNEKLLLIAHGYRPESAPLVADLFPPQAAYATLLNEGWMVAKTSYRRNGIIVADAIFDLDNLNSYISENYGTPKQVIVKGDSMGGTIATLLSERGGPHCHGLIAIGAALDLRENNGSSGVSIAPAVPLLFVSNRSEISGPTAYVRQVNQLPNPAITSPALFRIDRDGHINVNQAERLFAIRAMDRWLERGRNALPPAAKSNEPFDATHPAKPVPSKITIDSDRRGLEAEVTEISAIYGNVWLNIQPEDLVQIGLGSGLWFEMTVDGKTYRVRSGKDFSSVEKGQWVIFPNADGFYWLSRNSANAAETAGLKVRDKVQIRRYDSAE